MPRFDQMNEGKYLKKEDFPQPALLTITGFKRENVARDDEPEEKKWVVYFQEVDRGLALNVINTQMLKISTGRESSEESIGCKVVLYNDPSVSMGGKPVGGVRVRAPRNQAPAPTAERKSQWVEQGTTAPAPMPYVQRTAVEAGEVDDVPF